MLYVETRVIASIVGVVDRTIRAAIERGSKQYQSISIEAKGRGGKKLLIAIDDAKLREAIDKGMVDKDVCIWDETGSPIKENSFILKSNIKEATLQEIAPDMTTYLNATPEQRQKALLRMEVIELYEHKDKRQSVKAFLNALDGKFDLLSMNEMKLFRYKKLVENAKKEAKSPLEALLDNRGRQKGTICMSEEMQEMAVRMFARRDNPLKVASIYQNILHQYKDAMCSYDVLNNFLNRWKRENASLAEFAQNADKWKNNRLAAFGSSSEKAKYPNHFWELDSTPCDIICKDGKRYAILGMVDVFSRRCTFWVDEKSSSYSISRLLRKAILKMGVPEHVVVDNGKDYQSNHFDSITYNLGVQKVTVPPFSGDMKPHIERLFGTLSSQLFEELEGYIGHSVADRSEIESRRGFAHKIASQAKWYEQAKKEEKRTFCNALAIKKDNLGLEVKVPVDAEKLQQIIDGWVEGIYEKREHSSIGKTPLKRWADTFMPVKSISDPRALDILLGESFERRVGKKGIRLNGALYQHVNLAYHIGEMVRIMCDDNMGHVFVYKMNYEPICIAEDYEYTGKSRAELAEGKRISHRIAREYARLLEEWEDISRKVDPNIRHRIDASLKENSPLIVTKIVSKVTEVSSAVMEASKEFARQDAEIAETSNVMNMEGEKLLPSGRPAFTQLVDRFIWDLEHDTVDESTNKLKEKQPDLWEIASKEFARKKVG
ncbi:MAG: transposase [Campylobacterales bacterium]|nr:transposase [Campylobacterales bacterium]